MVDSSQWAFASLDEGVLAMPPPGIYEGVPHDVYRAWDAVSFSRLKRIDDCPLQYKLNTSTESAAMKLGSYVHCALLEPDELDERFVVPSWHRDAANVTASGNPSESKATAYYKSMRQAAEESGVTIVSDSDADMLDRIKKVIADNNRADQWLNKDHGWSEVSIVWTDKHTGLMCKARIDRLTPQRLIDVKTCMSCKPSEFMWDIYKRGYHRQAAWYLKGWNTLASEGLTEPVDEFAIIAVGKDSPVQVTAAPLSEDAIRLGENDNIEALAMVEYCMARDEWPGHQNPTVFDLPPKAYPDLEGIS